MFAKQTGFDAAQKWNMKIRIQMKGPGRSSESSMLTQLLPRGRSARSNLERRIFECVGGAREMSVAAQTNYFIE